MRIKQLKEEGYQLKAIKIILQQEKQAGLHKEQPAAAEHVTKPQQLSAEAKGSAAQVEKTMHLPEKKQRDNGQQPYGCQTGHFGRKWVTKRVIYAIID